MVAPRYSIGGYVELPSKRGIILHYTVRTTKLDAQSRPHPVQLDAGSGDELGADDALQ